MSGVRSVAVDADFKCYHLRHQGAKSSDFTDLSSSYVDELGGSAWADAALAEDMYIAAREAANYKAQAYCEHARLRALGGVEPCAARARDIEALVVLACPHGHILVMFDILRGGESLVHAYVALLLLRFRLVRLAEAGIIKDAKQAMPRTVAGDTACQFLACFQNIEKGMARNMRDQAFLGKHSRRTLEVMGMRYDGAGNAVGFDGLLDLGMHFGVNEFHLGSHGFACQVLHGANSLAGACKLDYEFVERLNRYLSHVGPLAAWRSLTGRRELLACTAARTQRLAHVRLAFEVLLVRLRLPADEAASARSVLEAGRRLELWDEDVKFPGNWLQLCAEPMAEVRCVVGSIARTARTNAEAQILSLRTRIVAEVYLGEQLRQKQATARNAHDQKIGGSRLEASTKVVRDNLRKLVLLEKTAAERKNGGGLGGGDGLGGGGLGGGLGGSERESMWFESSAESLANKCWAGQFPWHAGPEMLPDATVLADKLLLYQRANN